MVSCRVHQFHWQLTLLVGSVTLLSALVKNIGALAMLIPAALKMAKKSDTSPSVSLMPMSFGSLLGGLITLIGTSPNIIVSRVREQMTGEPFGMFDYAPVGLGLLLAGLLFLRFGYRLLPADRRAAPTLGEALEIDDYTIEAVITANSPLVSQAAGEMKLHENHGVNLLAISRSGHRLSEGVRDTKMQAGDVIVLQGPLEILPERLVDLGCLPLAERPIHLGSVRRGVIPDAILAGAMALAAFGVVPATVAFFGAAVLLLLTGALPLKAAYEHVEWPILVMGPGGYRFGGYARLGAPLSLIVIIIGVPLILFFWPVT